jgi:hypothetical protein
LTRPTVGHAVEAAYLHNFLTSSLATWTEHAFKASCWPPEEHPGPAPEADCASDWDEGGNYHYDSDLHRSRLSCYCLHCAAAGVGITGELPDKAEALPDAAISQVCSSDQAEAWQDPTERLALALGLQVTQLAHYTGRVPGNPDGALHRLR